MPWDQAWSGAGVLIASSVQVVGNTTEIDINAGSGLPGEAQIVFIDKSGNNAPSASITGSRDAANNAMTINLNSGEASNGLQSSVSVGDQSFAVTAQLAGSGSQSQILVSEQQIQLTSQTTMTNSSVILNPTGMQVNSPITFLGESWHAPTFANSWHNLGSPYSTAAYLLMPDGTVRLRGVVVGGTLTDGTVITTLPTGYRPPADKILPVGNGTSGSVLPNIRIRSATGNIEIWGVSASTNGTHSWDGITFETFA